MRAYNSNTIFNVNRSFFQYLLIFTLFIFSDLSSYAQESSVDSVALADELSNLKNDSLLAELRLLLDSMDQRGSFFSVSTSVSNRLFSTKNYAFNSQQTNLGITAFMPSVAYFHHSGFGLSATGYIRNISGSPSFYQTALSPSYDKINQKLMYGVSYSYYIKKQDPNTLVTPYNHELYAYIQGRKTWLRPSLALGWATGTYQDISSFTDTRFGIPILVTDTSQVRLSDFSVSASVSHMFSFQKVFSKKAILTLIPQLSLIGGVQSYSSITKSSVRVNRSREEQLRRVRRLYRVSSSSSSTMSLQTAAFSTNLSWYKGAVSLSAGYFLGYYFDNNTGSRVSHIFNLSAGVTI
ncbi:MAG: hypothetical protein ACK5AO_09575 [bacterium]